MKACNTIPYVQRTTIIDANTGEVVDEQTRRMARHYHQVRRAELRNRQREARQQRLRTVLTREAHDLLIAGFLVTLMGVLLWMLAQYPGIVE